MAVCEILLFGELSAAYADGMPALKFDITFNINRLPLFPVWFSTAVIALNDRIAAKIENAPHGAHRG
jgi:hypothetical protein